MLACADLSLAKRLAGFLATPDFRLYAGSDPIGVETGAAAKNVIAIAAGAAIGAGFGENARAALITRGIAEVSRLIVGLGGRPDTAFGLSGIGDLVLTCTGASSRNYSLGVALGEGQALAEILAERSTVAEGVETAPALAARARGDRRRDARHRRGGGPARRPDHAGGGAREAAGSADRHRVAGLVPLAGR